MLFGVLCIYATAPFFFVRFRPLSWTEWGNAPHVLSQPFGIVVFVLCVLVVAAVAVFDSVRKA